MGLRNSSSWYLTWFRWGSLGSIASALEVPLTEHCMTAKGTEGLELGVSPRKILKIVLVKMLPG